MAGLVLYLFVARLSTYDEYQVGEIGAYVVALVGLSLLTGVNGQISLGHGAFMAIGAYTVALLVTGTRRPTSCWSWRPRPAWRRRRASSSGSRPPA